MRNRFFTLLPLLWLTLSLACENEQEKYLRLGQSLNKLQKSIENTERYFARLQQEQKQVIAANAKERFASLYPILKNQWQVLLYEDYITELQLQGPTVKKSQAEYFINVRFNFKEPNLRPHFAVHLHDSKGLLLGSCTQEKAKLTQAEKQYKLVLDNQTEPVYFRIELWQE